MVGLTLTADILTDFSKRHGDENENAKEVCRAEKEVAKRSISCALRRKSAVL